MGNICCFKVYRDRAIFPARTADVAAECVCTRKLEMNSRIIVTIIRCNMFCFK